jgi:hypothetical protein
MHDIDDNEVTIGDVAKVLSIRDDIKRILAEDEQPHTLGMLNNNYQIDDIVNGGTQISVSYWVQEDQGCIYGGLHLYPNEFRLVQKKIRKDSARST